MPSLNSSIDISRAKLQRGIFIALALIVWLIPSNSGALPSTNANCSISSDGGNPATEGLKPPNTFEPLDEFGVNLLSGSIVTPMPLLSIGPTDGGITYSRSYESHAPQPYRWRDNLVATLDARPIFCGNAPYNYVYTATAGGQTIEFYKYSSGNFAGQFLPMAGGGETLISNGNGSYTLTLADGTRVEYSGALSGPGLNRASVGRASRIERPSGETTSFFIPRSLGR